MNERFLPPLPLVVRVSVSVPCRNEQGYIGACLRSIIAADRSGMDLRVFVCDGLSDDGTREEVLSIAQQHPFVTLLDNAHRTTPFALNLGLRAAPFDVGIILGGHAEVDQHFFQRGVDALRSDATVGCAGGVIENTYADSASRRIGAAMAQPFGVGNAHFRTGSKSGYVDTVAFGAYRHEVFQVVGWFDEELARNQDDEFNFRVTQAGFRILLDPLIRSCYVVRASYGKLWRQYHQYGYWKVYVNRKHRAVTTVRQLVPAFWVAGVCVGAPLSWCWPMLLPGYVCALVAYVLAAVVAAWRSAPAADLFGVVRAFIVLHAAYGLGYWQGILHGLFGRRRPGAKDQRLTR